MRPLSFPMLLVFIFLSFTQPILSQQTTKMPENDAAAKTAETLKRDQLNQKVIAHYQKGHYFATLQALNAFFEQVKQDVVALAPHTLEQLENQLLGADNFQRGRLHTLIGELYLQQDQLSKAVTHFSRVPQFARQDAYLAYAMRRKAGLYLFGYDPPNAPRELRAAGQQWVRFFPKLYEGYYYLGLGSSTPKQRAQYFEQALDTYPPPDIAGWLHNQLGDHYFSQAPQWGRALYHYKHVLKTNSGYRINAYRKAIHIYQKWDMAAEAKKLQAAMNQDDL